MSKKSESIEEIEEVIDEIEDTYQNYVDHSQEAESVIHEFNERVERFEELEKYLTDDQKRKIHKVQKDLSEEIEQFENNCDLNGCNEIDMPDNEEEEN